ncbi:MAG: alpha/beta fold hydrolase [Planctomycetes bacterium]|nr:alpha/beta fold hydrolase [Planctomycetota bacterium]
MPTADEFKQRAVEQLAARPFRPVWWARSGFAQTALAGLGNRRHAAELAAETWNLPDGDFVQMHFADHDPRAPLVLLLHGLEGSRRSTYVGAMLRQARNRGFGFAVLEFRSCSGQPNRAKRSYHSGETSDLGYVVERLRARWPERPLLLVGYSLGGNVLLKWLGECSALVPDTVCGAAAVSVPYDLGTAARQCDARYGGLLTRHFLRTLVPKALAKAQQYPRLLDAAAVRRCRTFAAFDDLVTAPLHGFRSAQHYWQTASSAQFLDSVRVPTLLVGAEDDPLVPGTVLPFAACAASPFLVPLFPARGGHCGFVAGTRLGSPYRWAERQVAQFFAQCLERVGITARAP